MRIYTKSGDDGSTGLLGPGRLSKDHPRIEAYGCVDELNATVGVARASGTIARIDASLAAIQDDLFVVGAALADPDPEGPFHKAVKPVRAERLEREIDAMESELPPLTQFILPGGSLLSAQLQLSRSTCRRAERLIVALTHTPNQSVPVELVIYLNRLSDHLFVIARFANHVQGVADIPWKGI
jgi:cob(I)alamin adenosyltransferase